MTRKVSATPNMALNGGAGKMTSSLVQPCPNVRLGWLALLMKTSPRKASAAAKGRRVVRASSSRERTVTEGVVINMSYLSGWRDGAGKSGAAGIACAAGNLAGGSLRAGDRDGEWHVVVVWLVRIIGGPMDREGVRSGAGSVPWGLPGFLFA